MNLFTKCAALLFGLSSTFSVSAARITILVGANGQNKFEPAKVTIHPGDEVEFKGASSFHPVMSDSNPPAWQVFTDATKVIVFSKAGTFPYYCPNHGGPGGLGMAGTITVAAALATAAPAAASAINLFPNPSRGGVVNVTLNERSGADYKLRLRNIIGQEVRTVALRPELLGTRQSLDLSDLPAGLYFYSLLVDNKAVLTKRLTLQ